MVMQNSSKWSIITEEASMNKKRIFLMRLGMIWILTKMHCQNSLCFQRSPQDSEGQVPVFRLVTS